MGVIMRNMGAWIQSPFYVFYFFFLFVAGEDEYWIGIGELDFEV